MQVLKRLIAFVVTGVTVLRRAAPRRWRTGTAAAVAAGLAARDTPVMDNIVWFHDFLLWIIAAIALFVLGCW